MAIKCHGNEVKKVGKIEEEREERKELFKLAFSGRKRRKGEGEVFDHLKKEKRTKRRGLRAVLVLEGRGQLKVEKKRKEKEAGNGEERGVFQAVRNHIS